MTRLLRFLGVQTGEGALAAGLVAYSFLLGVGRVFVLTASQALFLQFYPASDLAYVYMIAAVATIATSAAYLGLGRRLSARDLILANLGFTVAVTVALRSLLGLTGSGWPAMATAAWFHVLFALSSFAFWGAATQLVDIRQGKRLFPLATTGDVVAFSLGGFFILGMVERIGTANLLWVGAGGFALAVPALLYATSRSPSGLGGRPAPRRAGDERGKVEWGSPYLRLMMAYFVLSAVVFVFLDNAFNDVAQRRFDGTAELARFFATYSAVAAIVNFLFRSMLAGRLVRRFGLGFGLAVLPAVVGVGAAAIGLAGSLLPGLAVVFWLTVITRMSDKVLRGVQYSSMATLYQPLMERGPAVQTTMDGIIDSAAIGLAGLALLGLNGLFTMTAVELSWFLVALCALWVASALGLKREFVRVLDGVLERRRLRGAALDVVGDEALRVVRERLDGERPEDVVYALDLFVRANPPDLASGLERLLDHPSDEVRLEALRHLEGRCAGVPARRIEELAGDAAVTARVRAAAIRVLAREAEDVPEAARTALASDDAELRRGAMVGLLRSGSIEGIVEAGAALLADLGSREASARASAAEVLRDAAIPSFHRHVGRLLEDPDPAVRARALEAAGATDRPELWARVVEALRDPNLLPIASRVLLGAAGRAVPALTAALARERGERGFRLSAIRVLGLHEGPEAAAALVSVSGTVDREERTVALAALARRARDLDGRRIGWLETALGVELAETAEAFATQGELADLESGGEVAEAAGTLRNAVEEDIRSARRRIFHILSLLKPGADLATAWESYDSGSRSRRAYALELLDGHLRTDERAAVFPLLEELASDERLAAIRRSRDLPRLPAERRLERLIADPGASAWTRLCARRLRVALASAAGPGGPSGVAATEAGDDASADETLTEAERRLYDRTRRLGAVELFRDLPAATLSRIVPRLQHMTAAPGTAIVREGEPGDGLYVVLEGRVRVHDGGRELAVLGGDAVFGEFTVLQRSPRTATVTAIEESGLLKLTQDDLLELMREHASVARTLIRVILRRLRENRESRRSGEAVSPDGPAAPR